MTSDEIGLAQSPAQAAEGDVRKALVGVRNTLRRMVTATPFNTNSESADRMASWMHAVAATELDLVDAALSAEGSAKAAAARLAAEEMRERAAGYLDARADAIVAAENGFNRHTAIAMARVFRDEAQGVRALPLPPSSSPEDQEKAKAAATPTIADPDGESGR